MAKSDVHNQKSRIEILSREDADRALQRIGQLERHLAGAEQDAEEEIDKIRKSIYKKPICTTTGEVVIICGEPEARDLLTHANNHCQDSLINIRAAIRRAHFNA